MRTKVAVFGESLIDRKRSDTAVTATPGGSPLNVAVGLARLGADVEFATEIGRDDFGDLILAHLHDSGVEITPGSIVDQPTSVAEAVIGADQSARYTFALTWDASAVPVRPAEAAHFGSIAAILEPGAERVLTWARDIRKSALVSFDPNVRPALMGSDAHLCDAVHRAAGLADIVKLSDEDLDLLGPGDHIGRWLDAGTSVVVVTEAERGARIRTAQDETRVAAPAVTVWDTIGAGDSFMAGLLWSLGGAGLFSRTVLASTSVLDLAAHARFAAACAAVTVSREGANPPRRDELLRAIVGSQPPTRGSARPLQDPENKTQ